MVVQFAKENPTWGYDRIQGALKNLGLVVSDQTVGNILKQHGIEPAPKGNTQSSWSTFIKAHWEVLGAVDFTTVEVWTRGGLVTFYILIAMRISTRHIQVAGITANPDATWVQQMGRNLTDWEDGFFRDTRYILVDRDKKFCPFRGVLDGSDTKPILLPPKSPNLNAQIERYMRSMKSECLDRMVFFGERSLRNALREYEAHYHQERNHHGLENRIIQPIERCLKEYGEVLCRNRLGGLLRYYYRDAA